MIHLTATRAGNTVWFTRDALGGVVYGWGTEGPDAAAWKALAMVQAGKVDKAVRVLMQGGYCVEVTE